MIENFINFFVTFATDILLPTMVIGFVLAVIMRVLVWFTVSRELWFAKEFEKRLNYLLAEKKGDGKISFYNLVRKLLIKCYYEVFELREKYRRRNGDHIMTVADRAFLIQDGAARLIRSTLRNTRYLNMDKHDPNFEDISKNVFASNPAFNKVLGIVPAQLTNQILNILPGLFIVFGIFGTFLGIMKALPELGNMDLSNSDLTKQVMDGFLLKISFSMQTSIVGILLSVGMSIINNLFSPENCYYKVITSYSSSLQMLWHISDNNESGVFEEFTGPRDPMDVAAQASVENKLNEQNLSLEKTLLEKTRDNPEDGKKKSADDKKVA